MRVSPLSIFEAKHDLERVAEWARQDAQITLFIPSVSKPMRYSRWR